MGSCYHIRVILRENYVLFTACCKTNTAQLSYGITCKTFNDKPILLILLSAMKVRILQ